MAQQQNAPSGVLYLLTRQTQLGSETLLTVSADAVAAAQHQPQPYHHLYTFHTTNPETARQKLAERFAQARIGRQHRYRLDGSSVAFMVYLLTSDMPELLIGGRAG